MMSPHGYCESDLNDVYRGIELVTNGDEVLAGRRLLWQIKATWGNWVAQLHRHPTWALHPE